MSRVELNDYMQVIAHYRISVDRNREAMTQVTKAIFDPRFAMLERSTGIMIFAAEESATHTALDAVIAPSGFRRDEMGSSDCHAGSIAS